MAVLNRILYRALHLLPNALGLRVFLQVGEVPERGENYQLDSSPVEIVSSAA
jgi:hypothetical protein